MPRKKTLAEELAELANPAPTKGMPRCVEAACGEGAGPASHLLIPRFSLAEFDPEADIFGSGPALEESDDDPLKPKKARCAICILYYSLFSVLLPPSQHRRRPSKQGQGAAPPEGRHRPGRQGVRRKKIISQSGLRRRRRPGRPTGSGPAVGQRRRRRRLQRWEHR